MIENTSKLRDTVKALTNVNGNGGVDILTESGAFRSTYDILLDIAKVWDQINEANPKNQAALLEVLAGKTRGSQLAAILQNPEDLENAYVTAMNSAGSAMAENEKYLDSIQGRIDIFTNSLQTMWMNFIDSSVVKFIVDLGSAVIKFVDAMGLVPTAVGGFKAVTTATSEIKKAFDDINNGTTKTIEIFKTTAQAASEASQTEVDASQNVANAKEKETNAKTENATASELDGQMSMFDSEMAEQVKDSSDDLTKSKEKETIALYESNDAKELDGQLSFFSSEANKEEEAATAGVTAATIAETVAKIKNTAATWLNVAATKALAVAKGLLKGLAIGAISMAVSKLISLAWKGIDNLIHRAEKLKEEVNDIKETYADAKKSFSENISNLTTSSDTSTYATLQDEFDALTKGVDAYGNNIALTTEQYERYQEICEQICDINPSLLHGYDSATEAIGRNSNALAELVEQQKRAARQEATAYVKDDNLKKLAQDAINDYKSAAKEYQSAQKDFKKSLKSQKDSIFDDSKDVATESMKNLGYKDADIKKILEQYKKLSYDPAMSQITGMSSMKVEFDYDAWFADYSDDILKNANQFNSDVQEAATLLNSAKNTLDEAQQGVIDTLLEVPASMEQYGNLNQSGKSFVTEWIKNSGVFEIDEDTSAKQVLKWKRTIKDMIISLSNGDYQITEGEMKGITAQDILDSIFDLDTSKVNWASYQKQIAELIDYLWQAIGEENNKLGFGDKKELALTLGIDIDIDSDGAKKQEIVNKLIKYKGLTQTEAQSWIDSQPASKVQAWMEVDWNLINNKDELEAALGQQQQINEFVQTETYSKLAEQVSSYNSALKETSEITIEGMNVSEDYYSSLISLGASEEQLSKCIDKQNGYMVTNVKALNRVLQATGKNISANINLAKSQARLKYYNLYKQMQAVVNGKKIENAATLNQIKAMYAQMTAIERTAATYSMLEQELLGAVNAYNKFEEAKEADSTKVYKSQAEEMIAALGTAFNEATLGSETAQAAIAGLVPESVYSDLDTLDEKMQAIYDYFTGGPISQYFTVEFDDNGAIQSVELTIDNLKKFVQDGVANGVFTGTWEDFNLDESITSLDQVAEKFNMTKEMVFAIFQTMEDYDISWLNGDFSTLFDQLLGDNLEYSIYNNTQALADLEYQLATGKITVDEYKKSFEELQTAQNENANKASQNIQDWVKAGAAIDDQKQKVQDLTQKIQEYDNARQRGEAWALNTNPEQLQNDLNHAIAGLQEALGYKAQLEEPTQLVVQAAIDAGFLDDIQSQIDAFEKENQDLVLKAKIQLDENGDYAASPEVTLSDAELAKLQPYLDLLNTKQTIEVIAGGDTEDQTAEIQTVQDMLDEVQATIENMPELKINCSFAIDGLQSMLDTISQVLPDSSIIDVVKNFVGFNNKENTNGKTKSTTGQSSTQSTNVMSSDIEEVSSFADQINAFFENMPDQFNDIAFGLESFFSETLPENFEQLKTSLQVFFTETLPAKWDEFWANVATFFTETVPAALGPITEPLKTFFTETIPSAIEKVKEPLQTFFTETLPTKFEEIWTNIVSFVTETIPAVVGEINAKIGEFFTVTIPEKWNEFLSSIQEKMSAVGEWANGIGEKLSIFFTEVLPQKWDELLDNIHTALTQTIPYAIGYVAGAIKRFFTEVLPEKWNELWDNIAEIAYNIEDYANEIKTKIQTFFTETIPAAFNELLDNIDTFIHETIPETLGNIQEKCEEFFFETLPEAWDEFWENVGDVVDNIKEWADELKDAVHDFFTVTIPKAWKEFWDGVSTYVTETILPALSLAKDAVVNFFTVTIPDAWNNFWTSVGALISENILPALVAAKDAVINFFTVTIPELWNGFWDSVGSYINENILPALIAVKDAVVTFFTVTAPTALGQFWTDVGTFITETIPTALTTIGEGISTFFTETLPGYIGDLWTGIGTWIVGQISTFWDNLKSGFSAGANGEEFNPGSGGVSQAAGNAKKIPIAGHHGKAYADGTDNIGLKGNETKALVGELGPEMVCDPSSGRYYTVGDNGAEMVNLPKGAIIFNHKQTADLLNNGHTASRGLAYASGNAHVGIHTWDKAYNKVSSAWKGTSAGNTNSSSITDDFSDIADDFEDISNDLSDASGDISEAANDFKETMDWVEVRLEEIDETLSLLGAKLENAVGYTAKNSIIDQMLGVNNTKLTNLQAGLQEYTNYAAKLLGNVPEQYRAAAQDGAIAIDEFAGDAGEAATEAINTYREWAKKVADLTQQIEELNKELEDLAKQKFDNVTDQFDNAISLIENANDKLNAQISLMEDYGYVASKEYYESMAVNTQKINEELIKERDNLQAVLDEQVKLGHIKVGSDTWYDMVNQLYEVDAAIVECESDLESYQNAINDIYWDNFDELINRLDYLKDETQNLIDLMGNEDLVITPENEDGWTADQVEWSKEGLASLGLYAQQMEIAEYRARQYAQAIDDLNKDYADGKYSQIEYLSKLNELKSAQYDSIESYYDAIDAIKDLNSTRIDSIKDGIQKEIDAYEELISKKKELLDSEKDAYDFQKNVTEKQKDIAKIQRQLAALEYDNSISAAAKRKQLQAELAEAQADLEETYLDRSYSNKQDALDKELESFQEEKNKEIENWEKYLEDIKQVITDSLTTVQANAFDIYGTLTDKANEYDLTLSDAVTSPWKDGAIAVSDYQTVFDTAASSTMDQLTAIKNAWQEVIDIMREEARAAIELQRQQNERYVSAQAQPQPAPAPAPAPAPKTVGIGSTINAGNATIYASSYGEGAGRQYFANDPIYTIIGQSGDYWMVRHRSQSSGVTGWFRKGDVKAYAKGAKEIKENQLAWIDELGEELVLSADKNGRLQYLTKGSSVIPANLTENLMKLGQLDPQDILDRNRPTISAPHITNNNIELNLNVGEIVRIDTVTNDTIPDLTKAIDKQLDNYMKQLNAKIRRKM